MVSLLKCASTIVALLVALSRRGGLPFNSANESRSLPSHRLCLAAECNPISPASPPSSLKPLFKNLSVYEVVCLASPVYSPTLSLHYETELRHGSSSLYQKPIRDFPFYLLINASSSGAPAAAKGTTARFLWCLQPWSRLPT